MMQNLSKLKFFLILVSQSCSQDGMEFTLRTPEDFRGRIYTYKHYDRPQCYVRGTGERTHVLRIPGVNGYPDCGTEQVRKYPNPNFSLHISDTFYTTVRRHIHKHCCGSVQPADPDTGGHEIQPHLYHPGTGCGCRHFRFYRSRVNNAYFLFAFSTPIRWPTLWSFSLARWCKPPKMSFTTWPAQCRRQEQR